MVDLRGKPPYLPKDMSYTDVLKMAIERGLRYFGYDAETWIDETTFTRSVIALCSFSPILTHLQSIRFM